MALQAYFDDWVRSTSHAALREDSVGFYRDLWGLFAQFCVARGAWPEDLTVDDLQGHLDDRTGGPGVSDKHNPNKELTPRYAWRLLRMIDRVLSSRPGHGDEPTAAATLLESEERYRFANAGRDALPDYLPAGDARRLVVYLSEARPRPGRGASAVTWKVLRNRASTGLQLGAGLTPGEVRALDLGDAIVTGGRKAGVPWKIRVPADATTPEREAPLAAWAGELLKRWLVVRAEQKIPGEVMFPSTRAGDRWGKESQYKAFRQVMQDAELELSPGGSFQLRHTYALRQLRRKHPPERVAKWLGVKDMKVMERYARVEPEPVDIA